MNSKKELERSIVGILGATTDLHLRILPGIDVIFMVDKQAEKEALYSQVRGAQK